MLPGPIGAKVATGAAVAATSSALAATQAGIETARRMREVQKLTTKRVHEVHQLYSMIEKFYGVDRRDVERCKDKSVTYLYECSQCANQLKTICDTLYAFSQTGPDTLNPAAILSLSRTLDATLMTLLPALFKLQQHKRSRLYIANHLEPQEGLVDKYNLYVREVKRLTKEFTDNVKLVIGTLQSVITEEQQELYEQIEEIVAESEKEDNLRDQFLTSIELLEEVLKASVGDQHEWVIHLFKENMDALPVTLVPDQLVTPAIAEPAATKVLDELLHEIPARRNALVELLLRPTGYEQTSFTTGAYFYLYYRTIARFGMSSQPPEIDFLTLNEKKEYQYHYSMKVILEKHLVVADKILAETVAKHEKKLKLDNALRFDLYKLTHDGRLMPEDEELDESAPRSDQLKMWQTILGEADQPEATLTAVANAAAKIKELQPKQLVVTDRSVEPRMKEDVVEALKTYIRSLQKEIQRHDNAIIKLQKNGEQIAAYKEYASRIDHTLINQYAERYTGMMNRDDFKELVWFGISPNVKLNGEPFYYQPVLLMNDKATVKLFMQHGADPTLPSKADNRLLHGKSLLEYFTRDRGNLHQDLLHLVLENIPRFITELRDQENSAEFFYDKLGNAGKHRKDLEDAILGYASHLRNYVPQGKWYEYGRSYWRPTSHTDISLLNEYLVQYKRLLLPKNVQDMEEAMTAMLNIAKEGKAHNPDGYLVYSYHTAIAQELAKFKKELENGRAKLQEHFEEASHLALARGRSMERGADRRASLRLRSVERPMGDTKRTSRFASSAVSEPVDLSTNTSALFADKGKAKVSRAIDSIKEGAKRLVVRSADDDAVHQPEHEVEPKQGVRPRSPAST